MYFLMFLSYLSSIFVLGDKGFLFFLLGEQSVLNYIDCRKKNIGKTKYGSFAWSISKDVQLKEGMIKLNICNDTKRVLLRFYINGIIICPVD